MAKRLDVWIPDGHTFVRESEWGSNMTKDKLNIEILSLNGLFYYDNNEMSDKGTKDK